MKSKIVIILSLLALLSITSLADDQRFSQANELYSQEEYEKALSIYHDLSATGLNNSLVEYNAGACYYRLQQPGKARFQFEKALRLDPADVDAAYNISFIESRYLKKTLREENFVTIDRFLWDIVTAFPTGLTLWLGIAAFMLIFLLATVKMLTPKFIPPPSDGP